jgi:hypothetical protein
VQVFQLMSGYSVAKLDEIEQISDGRCPWRPVRHHFGIASFGVNAWTGRDAGDRISNEHDEADENEELYLVQRGRATLKSRGVRYGVVSAAGRSARRYSTS